jgi:hypothetical protein
MIQGGRVEADNYLTDVRVWLRDSIDDQFLDTAKDGSFHAPKLKATDWPTRACGLTSAGGNSIGWHARSP